MPYLCDTNILNELARPQPNPGVIEWASERKLIILSVITLEEIVYRLCAKPNPRIQTWFQNFLSTYCQVLPITLEIAQLAGAIRGELRQRGITRSQADILIAATARIHRLTLVTRNVRDSENCGLSVLNPFT